MQRVMLVNQPFISSLSNRLPKVESPHAHTGDTHCPAAVPTVVGQGELVAGVGA